MMKISLLILTFLLFTFFALLLWPRDDAAITPEIRVATVAERKAIFHMGPGYWYTFYPNGARLYVDRGDGKGKRRLRY
jgi:hypothetical protein